MCPNSNTPNEAIAAAVVSSMTNEDVLSSTRMTTGDQYFVFDIKTARSEYVIRMTDKERLDNFQAGIYWQEKLIPLGIPLAEFINSDLNGEHSAFPSLLMNRLPGSDICNVYSSLSDADKKNLAQEIIKIQALTNSLPNGSGYGITPSYEQVPADKSWYEFLLNRLYWFKDIIRENGVYNEKNAVKVIELAKKMKEELRAISSCPFLWDASERNVIIHQGTISGIVDVDDICFGDPLLVIALTAVALETEGHDTLYTDYWAAGLQLDAEAQQRLDFYRLFYIIVFMRKQDMKTSNAKKVAFDSRRLQDMFNKLIMNY